MANEFLNALSDGYVEQVTPGARDFMAKNDPIFSNVFESRMSTARDPIDGQYKVVRTLITSLAGGLSFEGVLGNQTIANTQDTVINESLPGYPGIQDSAMPGLTRYQVSLTKVKSNLYMPFTALESNELGAALTNYPAEIVRKHIELLAHTMACSWYADSSGGLVQLNTNATSGNVSRNSSDAHLVTITTDSGRLFDAGRARRLKPGQYVDVWSSDHSTCYNPAGFVVVVSAFNYQNRTASNQSSLTLWWSNTSELDTFAGLQSGSGSTNPDNCWLMPRDNILDKTSDGTGLSVLPCGFQSWVINSGTLYGTFGNVSVGNRPELVSITDTSVGDISENVLNAYLALYFDAIDGELDTILTTSGVLTNLLEAPSASNLLFYERQGQALDLKLGWKGISYTYDGREFTIYQSPYMARQQLAVLKTSDKNLQRHYPPRLPGTGTKSGYDPAVQFVGQMFGDSVWMPVYNVNAVAEGAQAPARLLLQHTADDPRGILLDGCTETLID